MPIDTRDALAERAALHAIGATAKADNLKALAEIATTHEPSHQLDHIRGIVATTMGHLGADATAATRESAAQWQAWALSLGDAIVEPQSPTASS